MNGQIIKIMSNLCTVDVSGKEYECRPRGKFRNMNITPIVGDYVKIDIDNNYILDILPRSNSLIRPLVSNIDQAFVITSLKEPDFSDNLLDKLLTVLYVNKIGSIICVTKTDLLTKSEKKKYKNIINSYKKAGYLVLTNKNKLKIKRCFRNKTSVFVGQTGAGKSTLLNKLNSKLNLETGEISKALGRGRHTTRHVELHKLFGGKVLDTPGFSIIDLKKYKKEEIRDSFIEFKKYKCPYADCMHINEKECAVKKAVVEGKILKSRYENYKKFINEV